MFSMRRDLRADDGGMPPVRLSNAIERLPRALENDKDDPAILVRCELAGLIDNLYEFVSNEFLEDLPKEA